MLTIDGRQANDAIAVGEGFKPVWTQGWAIGKAAAGQARPGISEEAGNCYVKRLIGTLRMAIEKPLGWIAGKGLWQAVRIFLRRDLLPVRKIEGNFDETFTSDFCALVTSSDGYLEERRGAKTPN